MVCDFCSSPNVMYAYPARNIFSEVLPKITVESLGGWCACEACSVLIEMSDWKALLERSVETQPCSYLSKEELSKAVGDVHQMFRSSRYGERRSLHN